MIISGSYWCASTVTCVHALMFKKVFAEVNKGVQWKRFRLGECVGEKHRDFSLCRPLTCTKTYRTHNREGESQTTTIGALQIICRVTRQGKTSLFI